MVTLQSFLSRVCLQSHQALRVDLRAPLKLSVLETSYAPTSATNALNPGHVMLMYKRIYWHVHFCISCLRFRGHIVSITNRLCCPGGRICTDFLNSDWTMYSGLWHHKLYYFSIILLRILVRKGSLPKCRPLVPYSYGCWCSIFKLLNWKHYFRYLL